MISAAQAADIKERARGHGFERAVFSAAVQPETAARALAGWLARGASAGMEWMRGERSPRRLLPDARGVISLGVGYYTGPVPPPPQGPAGRVARYAWGEDYHAVIGRRLAAFETDLHRIAGPSLKIRRAVDAQPLLEKALARAAGMGFAGENTLLISPPLGSWLFLAEIVVNMDLPPDSPLEAACGPCALCRAACSPRALTQPPSVDARRCAAYLTVEHRGPIPRGLRPAIGPWIFGCDDCQSCCPHNREPLETRWPEFRPEHGAGPWLLLEDVLRLSSDGEFKSRFRGTSLLRSRREGLVRNACVAAANLKAAGPLRPLLEDRLRHDLSPVVRGHAAWALGQEGGPAGRRALERALAVETSPYVVEEIRAVRGEPLAR